MEQKIEQLNADDLARVEGQREWVRDHYEPEARHMYDTLEGKLRLLDTIIRSNWIQPDETVKLQCLGITLGDALAQKLNMKWMAVEDEYGRDPALIMEGTSIVLFPLTMISKRIEKGEQVDVYDLFEGICAGVAVTQEEAAMTITQSLRGSIDFINTTTFKQKHKKDPEALPSHV